MPALITWWRQDLARLSPYADPTTVLLTGADLLRRWTEPHRRYHSTRHLVEVFWALDEVEEAGVIGAEDAAVGRLAGWLHDAVHEPLAATGANETASAELAAELLPRVGITPEVVSCVEALVRMTADHAGDAGDPLTAAFHDADLWILSSPPERYDAYTAQVREEYAAVPDDAFRAGRAAILTDFAARQRLYLTEHAHAAWDVSARVNLERELATLR